MEPAFARVCACACVRVDSALLGVRVRGVGGRVEASMVYMGAWESVRVEASVVYSQ